MSRTRDAAAPDAAPTERRLREAAFVHDVAQLATQARDWDELMRAIVDGTTTALGVEVCSFYLADRDQPRLTLAATNGLDRSQIGREPRVRRGSPAGSPTRASRSPPRT
jgi:GAF domain-containing protein